jgi:hypothetical protein
VFIGCSTTFDTGPVSETYPHLVNENIRHNGLDTDYINAGVGAYTSTESSINYHLRVRTWDPDLVVFYNARNDLIVSWNNLYSPNDMTLIIQPPYYNFPPKVHRSISRFSVLYALSMELLGIHSFRKNNWDWRCRNDTEFAGIYGRPRTVDEFMENVRTERALDVYRRNVQVLSALIDQSGVILLLVGYDFCPEKLVSVGIPRDRVLTSREKEFVDIMIKK